MYCLSVASVEPTPGIHPCKGDTYVHEQLFLVFAHSGFLVIQTCTGERCTSRFRTGW